MTRTVKKREITGRKVALAFCGGFATIIAANMALVYAAIGTFPGLETRAPYAESLSFESRRIAQERLGWTSSVVYSDGTVVLTLTEPNGGSVVTPNIEMEIGRATSSAFDRPVELTFDGHNYVADIELPAGNWRAKVTATALDGTLFTRKLSLYIRPAS